jgi:hypothetical protein
LKTLETLNIRHSFLPLSLPFPVLSPIKLGLEPEEGAGLGQELSTSGTWRERSALEEGPGTSEVGAASLEEGAGAGGDGGEVGLLELVTSGFCSMVKRQIMIKVVETLDYKGTWHQVQVVGL